MTTATLGEVNIDLDNIDYARTMKDDIDAWYAAGLEITFRNSSKCMLTNDTRVQTDFLGAFEDEKRELVRVREDGLHNGYRETLIPFDNIRSMESASNGRGTFIYLDPIGSLKTRSSVEEIIQEAPESIRGEFHRKVRQAATAKS